MLGMRQQADIAELLNLVLSELQRHIDGARPGAIEEIVAVKGDSLLRLKGWLTEALNILIAWK